MSFKIRGHSGAKVEIQEDLIIKSVSGEGEWKRLLENIEKQKGSQFIYPTFLAPAVRNIDHSHKTVQMDLVKGYDLFSVITDFSDETQDKVVGLIKDYITYIITSARKIEADKMIFSDKILDCARKISVNKACHSSRNELKLIVHDLYDAILKPFQVLQGPNHGDFTMGNLIYNPEQGRLFWFDFLVGFYSSPFLDLAKIQQEFDYGWTALMIDGLESKDRSLFKCKMADFFEGHINRQIEDLGLTKARLIFSQMNDLRLLQYEKRESVAELISSTMMVRSEMIKELL